MLLALLDLDPLVGLDGLPQDDDIVLGSVKRLVTASLRVVDVFADDFPVIYIEGLLAQDLIGVPQSVEEKSRTFSINSPVRSTTREGGGLELTDA